MNKQILFIALMPFLLTNFMGAWAQHKNKTLNKAVEKPHECLSCQHLKRETLHAYQQWGIEKSLNIDYNRRSDTIDIIHYTLNLTIDDFSAGNMYGSCAIDFQSKMNGVGLLTLDLLRLNIDSIKSGNSHLTYTYNDTLLYVQLPSLLNANDNMQLTVYYKGRPQSDAQWGGFYFQNGYAYNLGVGFAANPHTFGRVWHPCFDNFAERATYTFHITTPLNKPAHCNGVLTNDVSNGSWRTRSWQMNTPIPTYLACIAAADYATARSNILGQLGNIPVELVAMPTDTQKMKNSFANLHKAIESFEYWFGPYAWDKVGYSAVPFNSGAMEHATNIAYPRATLDGTLTYETLMAHELSHHWWGDLVTCETAEDMWINEGLASYCEHLFLETTYGRSRYLSTVKSNHYDVLLTAHGAEGGYRPISGVPHQYTYGKHVYNKGASVAHSLRWYLGDSLFRVGMTAVLDSFRLNNVNSTTMRDVLSNRTGVDLTDFFNDWVFNGGFSHFEIDSISITPTPALNEVTIRIKQKLVGAPNYHNSTPLLVTFMDNNWNKMQERVLVSGTGQVLNFSLPITPTLVILNENHGLNQARMDYQTTIRSTGTTPLNYVRLSNFLVSNLVDSAWIHAEYHPLAPDTLRNNPYGYRISNKRYWNIQGIWDPSFQAEMRIEPSISLDPDLMAVSGMDSMILLYRESPNVEWHEHPDYVRMQIGGFGYIRVKTVLKGDYALANGQMGLGVHKEQTGPIKESLVFPNPVDSQLQLELKLKRNAQLSFEIYDINGRLLQSKVNKTIPSGTHLEQFMVENLSAGIYFLKIKEAKGGDIWATHKFVVY